MDSLDENHYATLGLDRNCSVAEIRAAYRTLAKAHHPDLNHVSPDAMSRTQALNCAYTVLSHPERRRAYDEKLDLSENGPAKQYSRPTMTNINQVVHISIQDIMRGVTLDVCVNDPANLSGPEIYQLVIPPETAPGTRFRLKRGAPFESGFVRVQIKVRPEARFKVRGSDLRYELKINSRRAALGGSESIRGPQGNFISVQIPAHVPRGEIIKIAGEGLHKARGGRGDLLVRISYRPEVRITRASGHKSESRPERLMIKGR